MSTWGTIARWFVPAGGLGTKVWLHLDRDSVCAADDCVSHAERREVAASAPISEVLQEVITGYLPTVAGPATWVARISGQNGVILAVVVQGQGEPRWVKSGWSLLSRARGRETTRLSGFDRISFNYRGTEDPDRVMDSL